MTVRSGSLYTGQWATLKRFEQTYVGIWWSTCWEKFLNKRKARTNILKSSRLRGWGAGTIASKGIVVTIKEGGREKQNGPDLRDA